MNIKYEVAEWIIIFEFASIALVILATLASKLFGYFNERIKKDVKSSIQDYLSFLMNTSNHLQAGKFSKKCQRLDVLLFMVNSYDSQFNNNHWHRVRLELMHYIILPLARVYAIKKNWVSQFYATQVLSLYAEEPDLELITILINSKFPVVRLAALQAGLKYGSETVFTNIINEIKDQPQLTQAVYIQAFSHAPMMSRVYIEKHLKTSSDINTRITCYRILLSYSPDNIKWDINADIYSSNKDLSLSALRLLSFVERDLSIPILIEKLKSNDWQTKVISLNALGYLQANDYIPKIAECLHDQNATVRLNAAQALKNLGEKGEQALLSKNITIDPKAFEVVRHVLRAI